MKVTVHGPSVADIEAERLYKLPKVDIVEILETFGWGMVGRLIGQFRGTLLEIPRNPASLKVSLSSSRMAEQLAEKFGGRVCRIPENADRLLAARDAWIREDYADRENPLTRGQLMAKYRITDWELDFALGGRARADLGRMTSAERARHQEKRQIAAEILNRYYAKMAPGCARLPGEAAR